MVQPLRGQDTTPTRPILFVNASGGHAVLADGHQTSLPGWDRDMSLPVWAPTGTRWAYAHGNGRSQTLALEWRDWKGHPHTLFTATAESFTPEVLAWAPDGTRLATILFRSAPAAEAVAVFDVAEGKVLARYSLPTDVVDPEAGSVSLQWSPNGKKILVVDQLALLVDVSSGAVDTLARDVATAQWAPGSDGVYYVVRHSKDTTGSMPRTSAELYHQRLDASAPVKLLGREQLAALGFKPLDLHGMWTASPSGTKLVAWANSRRGGSDSPDSNTSVVYIYGLSITVPLALEQPARVVRLPEWWIIRRLEWSPDERSVAMFGARTKPDFEFEIRLLDTEAGTWHTVVQVTKPGEDADVYLMTNMRLMSWTQ